MSKRVFTIILVGFIQSAQAVLERKKRKYNFRKRIGEN